jgi:murein DD-endopeptidase MepM/ murein hydrolase activator NlpD
MTGKAVGPHVHYEVWKDGKKVNPFLYILEE